LLFVEFFYLYVILNYKKKANFIVSVSPKGCDIRKIEIEISNFL